MQSNTNMGQINRQWGALAPGVRRLRARGSAICLALAGALIIANGANAKTPEPPGLFRVLPGSVQGRLPAQAIEGRARKVAINHGLLRSGRFFVNLPGGFSMEAVRDLQQEMGGRRFSWVGRAQDDPDSRVILGVSANTVAGTFAYRGRLFKLEPRANGSHVISEVLASDPAPTLDPIPVADSAPAVAPESDPLPAGDGGPVIDVLVAYTTRIEALYGQRGADALIIQAVAEANRAYGNSGILPRLNLVHTAVTDYRESGSMSTDLTRLQDGSDGHMDELHALRDQFGADLVSLIEDDASGCGLAYRMTSASSSFASYAFSVVHYDCATGYYSFAHELGHNQGAHHDPDNAGSAIYPYAYGYQDPFRSFRTVMAYNCDGGCQRVDHFSNPAILLNGQPTGADGLSDNARTLNNTAATVAAFREQVAQQPPSAPSALTATAAGYSAIALEWSDTASDESGFHLERSEDGAAFAQVASLPPNTAIYQDDNLIADTLYAYRVRAWNSAGSSDYSDVALVATDVAPPVIEQVAQADLPVAALLGGSYQRTWSEDGNDQVIQEVSSSGNRNSRYGYLEHKWAFEVQPANVIELLGDIRTTAPNESFTFAYSTDDANYIGMFTVDAASSGIQRFRLPPELAGTVYIRVTDNVRNAGEESAHAVLVDQLLIRSERNPAPEPPPEPSPEPPPSAPAGLSAFAEGTDAITINWIDRSDNETGFILQRREEGAIQWQAIDVTAADITTYGDQGLQADTLYYYRVAAFNDAGESVYSSPAAARTHGEPPAWLPSKGTPNSASGE